MSRVKIVIYVKSANQVKYTPSIISIVMLFEEM